MTSPHPNTDRARKHKDGSVLLSIAGDSVCRLNGVGALTWMILEDTGDGLSLDEIVRALEQEFAAINVEGELRYDVPHEQLQTDTDRFLQMMVSLGLLKRSCDGFYSVS